MEDLVRQPPLTASPLLLVAAGLLREARILAAPGWHVLAGGGDAAVLEARLEAMAPRAAAILSMGIAGALSPLLRPGDWVVPSTVNGTATDTAWQHAIAGALGVIPCGLLLGRDAMVAEAEAKAALHTETGAAAVDMESHIAARVAARHGKPFAVARVISDAAHHTLPPAARLGMRADGSMNLPAVLASLARDLTQLPALIRTGWHAEKAFRALLRGHRRLRRALPPAVADLDPA